MARVLIQCGNHLDNQSRILPLALALKEQGWSPVVMVYSIHTGNLFLEHGIDTISLDQYRPVPAYRRLLHQYLARRLTLNDKYRGLPLRECLYIDQLVEPWHFRGASKRGRFKTLFQHMDSLLRVIKSVEPAFIIIWNGYTGHVANVLRVFCSTASIPNAFIERGPIKESLFIDKKGVNGFSSLADVDEDGINSAELDKEVWAHIEEAFLPSWQDNTGFERELEARYQFGDKKIVFLPLQVESDTNIVMHSKYVSNMRDFCLLILDALDQINEPDIQLIVRPHPEELPGRNLFLPRDRRLTVTSFGSVDEWISRADLTVTINSTVGYEAALRGKQVLALGKALYTGKKFIRSVGPGSLAAAITDALSIETSKAKLMDQIQRRYTIKLARDYLVYQNSLPLSRYNKQVANEIVGGRAAQATDRKLTAYNYKRVDVQSYFAAVSNEKSSFLESVKSSGEVNVLADLKSEDCLNLTYRLNKVAISEEYLRDRAISFFDTLNISELKIRIFWSADTLQKNIPTLIVRGENKYEANYNPKSICSYLIVDQYFNLHPQNLKIAPMQSSI